MKSPYRSLMPGDVCRVLPVEAACFGANAWTADDFEDRIWSRRGGGVLCTGGWVHTPVQGYAVYVVQARTVDLLRLAVAPGCRKRGVGRELARLVAERLDTRVGRDTVRLDVRETNLDAQKFWRSLGYRAPAEGAVKHRKDGTFYRMELTVGEPSLVRR